MIDSVEVHYFATSLVSIVTGVALYKAISSQISIHTNKKLAR